MSKPSLMERGISPPMVHAAAPMYNRFTNSDASDVNRIGMSPARCQMTISKITTRLESVIVAALIRFPFAIHYIHHGGFNWSFGGEMAQVALSLASSHGFGSPYGGSTGPTALVLPIYPAFLAVILHLFGPARGATVAVLSNVIWSSLACLPLLAIGKRLGIGSWAAWVWAFAPLTGFTDVAFFWDTSLLVLVTTVLVAWTLAIDSSSNLLWYGIAVGASSLLDTAHVPAMVLILVALLSLRRITPPRQFTLALAGIALIIVPWIIRNSLVFGHPMLRSNAGMELYRGLATSPSDVLAVHALNPGRSPAEYAHYVQLGESRYMAEQRQKAFDFIAAHPGLSIERVAYRAMEFWWGTDLLEDNSVWTIPSLLKHVLFLLPALLAFYGLAHLARQDVSAALVLGLMLVFFSMQYYLTITEPRYRAPIDPLLYALLAFALSSAFGKGLLPNEHGI